jgi:hypothetical protein
MAIGGVMKVHPSLRMTIPTLFCMLSGPTGAFDLGQTAIVTRVVHERQCVPAGQVVLLKKETGIRTQEVSLVEKVCEIAIKGGGKQQVFEYVMTSADTNQTCLAKIWSGYGLGGIAVKNATDAAFLLWYQNSDLGLTRIPAPCEEQVTLSQVVSLVERTPDVIDLRLFGGGRTFDTLDASHLVMGIEGFSVSSNGTFEVAVRDVRNRLFVFRGRDKTWRCFHDGMEIKGESDSKRKP